MSIDAGRAGIQGQQMTAKQLAEQQLTAINGQVIGVTNLHDLDNIDRQLVVLQPVLGNDHPMYNMVKASIESKRAQFARRPEDDGNRPNGFVQRVKKLPGWQKVTLVAVLLILVWLGFRTGTWGMLWGFVTGAGAIGGATGGQINLTAPSPTASSTTTTISFSDSNKYSTEGAYGSQVASIKGSDLKESWKLLNLGVSLSTSDAVYYKVFDVNALQGFISESGAPMDSVQNFALALIGHAAKIAGNWAIGEFTSLTDTKYNKFVAPVFVGQTGDKYGLIWVFTDDSSPVTIKRLTERGQLNGNGFVQFKGVS